MTSSFPLPKAYFVALFCEAILHGMYTVSCGGALYLLLYKRRRQTRRMSPINITMVFLTVTMYSLSTTHIALSLHQNLIAFFEQHAADGGLTILNDQGSPLVYTQIAIEVINCLLGDSIVCWRTWVLWGRRYSVIAIPATCILGGAASGIGLIRAFAVSPGGEEVYNADITRWFEVFGALTLAANIYAVVAISYRAWQSMRALRELGPNVVIHGGKYYGALLVVIESGVLYSVALIITISLFLADNNGVYVITDMLGHLTGIYPTVIIVLVTLKMTFHDDVTRAEMTLSTIRCAPPPDLDPGQKMQPTRLAWRRGGRRGNGSRTSVDLESTKSYPLQPTTISAGPAQNAWYNQDISGTIGNSSLQLEGSAKAGELAPV